MKINIQLQQQQLHRLLKVSWKNERKIFSILNRFLFALFTAVNQLVGAPVDSRVTLECIVEAFPKPLNGWYRNEGAFFN